MTGRHRAERKVPRVRETSDIVAAIMRMHAAYARRIADDPIALVHAEDLQKSILDAVNVGIYNANKGRHNYSQNHMAAIFGRTRQAIQQRISRGEAYLNANHVVRIADIRERRAELAAAAGLMDEFGSERERRAV